MLVQDMGPIAFLQEETPKNLRLKTNHPCSVNTVTTHMNQHTVSVTVYLKMCSCSCSRSPYDRPQCTLRIVHYNSVHSELYNRLLAMRCQSGPVHSWHAPCGPSPSTACTKPLTVARSQPLTVCDEVCSRGCVRAQDFWCSEPLSGYREHSLEHTSPSSQLPAMRIWFFMQVWMCVPGSLSCCPAAERTGVPSQVC